MVRLRQLAEVAKTWTGMKRDTAGSGFFPWYLCTSQGPFRWAFQCLRQIAGLPLLADVCSRNLSNRRVRTVCTH